MHTNQISSPMNPSLLDDSHGTGVLLFAAVIGEAGITPGHLYVAVTGPIITFSEEEILAAEEEDDLDNYPEWQLNNIHMARNFLTNEEDYLCQPTMKLIYESDTYY